VRATKLQGSDEFIAPSGAFADPPDSAEMNERLSHPGRRAYLANHVRR